MQSYSNVETLDANLNAMQAELDSYFGLFAAARDHARLAELVVAYSNKSAEIEATKASSIATETRAVVARAVVETPESVALAQENKERNEAAAVWAQVDAAVVAQLEASMPFFDEHYIHSNCVRDVQPHMWVFFMAGGGVDCRTNADTVHTYLPAYVLMPSSREGHWWVKFNNGAEPELRHAWAMRV